MDNLECSLEDMSGALRFLETTNRRFGGSGVILRFLENCSKSWGPRETVTILDLGCGLADIPAAIAAWARKKGLRVRITGLEKVPQIAALAREHVRPHPEISILERDVFSLPGSEGNFDYVTASLFLHHMPQEKLPLLFQKVNALAKRGAAFSDLSRGPLGYWSVKALCALMGNRVVRHDGPLSVQRSFTIEELEALAGACGCPYLTARKEPFFRLSLSGEKDAG